MADRSVGDSPAGAGIERFMTVISAGTGQRVVIILILFDQFIAHDFDSCCALDASLMGRTD